jgi:hypothetical protein
MVLSPINMANILVPATEHCYFAASWWHTPLHHPPKLTRFYFQQTSCINVPVGKWKGCSLSRKKSRPHCRHLSCCHNGKETQLVKFTRNNTHTALASVLTYYGWVSLIC